MLNWETYLYFFAKVDNGNRLLKAAKDFGGFYIGFFDEEKPEDYPILDFPQDDSHPVRLNYPDWEFINLFSETRWRDRVRVITYDESHLTFWKITGKVSKFDGAVSPKQKAIGLSKVNAKKTDSDTSLWHFLPVAEVNRVQRSLLPAPIDSLSVYQYLNRGTFRPIMRLAEYKKVPEIKDYPALPQISIKAKRGKVTTNEPLVETAYGQLVRVFLDAMVENGYKYSEHLREVFGPVSEPEKFGFVQALFNPAQVETLGMLLLQDLGLTVDIGVGKGLDFVDVKGTARHHKKPNIAKSLKKLRDWKLAELSPGLEQKITTERTINLQCKAEPVKPEPVELLYLMPKGKATYKDLIYTDTFIELIDKPDFAKEFSKTHDWLMLQKHALGF